MNTASSTSPFGRLAGFYCAVARLIGKLQPLLLLGFRLYVARVFLLSGLTKIHDWSITVALFTDEYHVPILPPRSRRRWEARPSCRCRFCWRWGWSHASPPVCFSSSTSSR